MTISFSSTKSTQSAALSCDELAAALCKALGVAMLWVLPRYGHCMLCYCHALLLPCSGYCHATLWALRYNLLLRCCVGFAGNGLLLGQCLVIFSLVFAVACYASLACLLACLLA